MKLFLLVFCAALISCGGEAPSDSKTFDGQAFTGSGYTINVPEGWSTRRNMMGADLFIMSPQDDDTTTFRENVNVVLENLPAGLSHEDYLTATRQQMRGLIGDAEIVEEAVTVNGLDGTRIRYPLTMGAHNGDNDAYIFTSGNAAYVITLSMVEGEGRELWLDRLRAVAETFRLE